MGGRTEGRMEERKGGRERERKEGRWKERGEGEKEEEVKEDLRYTEKWMEWVIHPLGYFAHGNEWNKALYHNIHKCGIINPRNMILCLQRSKKGKLTTECLWMNV